MDAEEIFVGLMKAEISRCSLIDFSQIYGNPFPLWLLKTICRIKIQIYKNKVEKIVYDSGSWSAQFRLPDFATSEPFIA